MRNWLRRWLGIDRYVQALTDRIDAVRGTRTLDQQATIESFKLLSAEIEKLRERIDQRAAEPTQTVRRAASHAEFRSAAEASVRAKK